MFHRFKLNIPKYCEDEMKTSKCDIVVIGCFSIDWFREKSTMTMLGLSLQGHDEVKLADDGIKSDFSMMSMDLQVIDAAYDFCQRLKARNLFFRKSQMDDTEDRKCVQNVYTQYIQNQVGVTSLKFLLEEAKKLKESNALEDVCLPLLVDHYYHHMSSTNFFILEFCEYGSLEKLLADNSAVPIHKQYIAKILHGVAKAIYFLHSQGIYHGTICTANILVDHYMTGRLTGLTGAQEITENMNKNMQLPMYAAPESVHPKAESLPQDMFALGVVLYQCLIGRIPKRKPNGTIDYHGIKSSITIPIDPKMWHTTQLLMSERLEMRLTAGQFLHTDWIESAATTPITQIFSWNN
ncbi:hypothetical protein X798_04585 [Onchocerca flexuosa]|uniref:Protein kinase domain-containing protein n=1 Tax=Onchocerca flexuosa TaxID=387005 RepID=A0A238BUK5_9BILA|nr:hypothetical protein X798_04585 [Onchocerca flexuosa]